MASKPSPNDVDEVCGNQDSGMRVTTVKGGGSASRWQGSSDVVIHPLETDIVQPVSPQAQPASDITHVAVAATADPAPPSSESKATAQPPLSLARRVVYIMPPSQFKFTDKTRLLLAKDRYWNPHLAVPRFTHQQLMFGLCAAPLFALVGLVVQAFAVGLMIGTTIQNGCDAYEGSKPKWGGQAWDVTSARIVMWFIVLVQVRSDFEEVALGIVQIFHGSRVAVACKPIQIVLHDLRAVLNRPGGCCALSCCSPCICLAGAMVFLLAAFLTLLNLFVFVGTLVATVSMLKSSCDAQSAFLNGLAVAFVTQVDNLVREFFLRLVDPAGLNEDEKMYELPDDEDADAETGLTSEEARAAAGGRDDVQVRVYKLPKRGITVAGVTMFRAFLVGYMVFIVVSGFLIFAL